MKIPAISIHRPRGLLHPTPRELDALFRSIRFPFRYRYHSHAWFTCFSLVEKFEKSWKWGWKGVSKFFEVSRAVRNSRNFNFPIFQYSRLEILNDRFGNFLRSQNSRNWDPKFCKIFFIRIWRCTRLGNSRNFWHLRSEILETCKFSKIAKFSKLWILGS